MLDSFIRFLQTTGIYRLIESAETEWWKTLIMFAISGILVYLAIVKKFEPLLLLPIAIGMLLTNLPGANMFHLDLFIGESVNFGGLLGYAPIIPLNPCSPVKFIRRGGRIPAPIHSLKNGQRTKSNHDVGDSLN